MELKVLKEVGMLVLLLGGILAAFADPPDLSSSPTPTVERWKCYQITYTTSDIRYSVDENTGIWNPPGNPLDVVVTVTFSHANRTGGTDKTIVRPAFWDGVNPQNSSQDVWKVRFAAPLTGTWSYSFTTSTKLTEVLTILPGTPTIFNCVPYSGNLDIYKHGFVKVEPTTNRYFTYDDGTPFLFLSDDHSMLEKERNDQCGFPGCNCGSQFKHILNLRKAQGFNMYTILFNGANSYGGLREPLNKWWKNKYQSEWEGYDYKIQYLADNGFTCLIGLGQAETMDLTPASTCGTTPGNYPNGKKDLAMANNVLRYPKYIEARYGAYPMIYYTAMETCCMLKCPYNTTPYNSYPNQLNIYPGRNCWYPSPGNGSNQTIPQFVRTWWSDFAQEIYNYNYNSYSHPQSINYGQGQYLGTWDFGKPFMNFWAVGAFILSNRAYYKYWYDLTPCKPMFDMGTQMDHGPGKVFGSFSDEKQRKSAYLFMQCGGTGFTYLAEGIYNSALVQGSQYEFGEGYPWYYAVDPAKGWMGASYFRYLYKFYSSIEWWKQVPRYADPLWASLAVSDTGTTVLTVDNLSTTYVVYFYGSTNSCSDKLKKMNTTWKYQARWFNPVTGNFQFCATSITPTASGEWPIPSWPESHDWILIVQKIPDATPRVTPMVFVPGKPSDNVPPLNFAQYETTYSEYFAVMAKIPNYPNWTTNPVLDCPASNVTCYDAILFCNAKSKKEGFDTVYKYTGSPSYSGGDNHCTSMPAITADFNQNGYRLPTLKEWQNAYLAGTSSNANYGYYWAGNNFNDYAWVSGNSCHIVGLKKPNNWNLFDMAGNVSEFVWDESYGALNTSICGGDYVTGAFGYNHYEVIAKYYSYGTIGFRVVRKYIDIFPIIKLLKKR